MGERIWSGRTAAEVGDATRHESLINLALAETNANLLCPYDTRQFDAATLADAHRTHPHIMSAAGHSSSPHYADPATVCAPDAWPLPAPRTNGEIVGCAIEQLADIRALVRHKADAAGLTDTAPTRSCSR